MRSHVGSITGICSRPDAPEFATISTDNTIRIWDALSVTQIIEFTSEKDRPSCLLYHPREHTLICGFESGYLRCFDVGTAEPIHEQKPHVSQLDDLVFISISYSTLVLATVGADGFIKIYDANNNFTIIRSISTALVSPKKLQLLVSDHSKFLIVSGATVDTIIVYETSEFSTVLKCSGSMQPPILYQKESSVSYKDSTPPILREASIKDMEVVSIVYLNDIPSGALVVVTAKYFVSIPMPLEPNAHSVQSAEKYTVKRITFGEPVAVRKDHSTGLLFCVVKAPISKGESIFNKKFSERVTSSDELAPHANAIVVLDAKHRLWRGNHLSYSSYPQLYQDHCGILNDVCPVTSFGRLVTVDKLGGMGVWVVRDENVKSVLVDIDKPSPQLDGYTLEMHMTPTSKFSQMHTMELTREFEIAATEDPAVWSAHGSSKKLKADELDSVFHEDNSLTLSVSPTAQIAKNLDGLLTTTAGYDAAIQESANSSVFDTMFDWEQHHEHEIPQLDKADINAEFAVHIEQDSKVNQHENVGFIERTMSLSIELHEGSGTPLNHSPVDSKLLDLNAKSISKLDKFSCEVVTMKQGGRYIVICLSTFFLSSNFLLFHYRFSYISMQQFFDDHFQ